MLNTLLVVSPPLDSLHVDGGQFEKVEWTARPRSPEGWHGLFLERCKISPYVWEQLFEVGRVQFARNFSLAASCLPPAAARTLGRWLDRAVWVGLDLSHVTDKRTLHTLLSGLPWSVERLYLNSVKLDGPVLSGLARTLQNNQLKHLSLRNAGQLDGRIIMQLLESLPDGATIDLRGTSFDPRRIPGKLSTCGPPTPAWAPSLWGELSSLVSSLEFPGRPEPANAV